MSGWRQGVWLAAAVTIAAAAAGCAADSGETIGEREQGASAMDRFIIGEATAYPANEKLRERFAELEASQAARRQAAWAIVKKVIEPVATDVDGHPLPRFQTWYSKDEIIPMYDRILRGQSAEDRAARTSPSPEAIAEAFEWEARRAPTLASWSEERFAQRRAELEAAGAASLGGPERVLMSPGLVGHLYKNYDALLRCVGQVPDGEEAPPSDTNFAPCVGEEFPADAVVIKARWIPDADAMPTYDMSAKALTSALTAGEWGEPTGSANPDESSIYTMRLSSGIRMRLAALHIATKELRDWVWISLFWSEAPNAGFGADRPDTLVNEWGGYQMCVSVDFDEKDDGANDEAMDPSLREVLAATRAFGPRSWCSNPYLEGGKHNAISNCIGCHQHGGTDNNSITLLEGPNAFPDGARAKVRMNFPADYTFVTNSGLGLAALMKGKYDQLVPAAPPSSTP